MEERNLAKASIQGFYAIAAPAGTPVSIVDRLVKEVDASLSTPESKTKWAELSLEAVSIGPDGLRAVIAAELARYRELNKRLKISME